jgi:hypothetical protein
MDLADAMYGQAKTVQEIRERIEDAKGYRELLKSRGEDVSEWDAMIEKAEKTLREFTGEVSDETE